MRLKGRNAQRRYGSANEQLRGRPRSQNGVTLVELMISLVIGLLILAGVTSVFFASRTTYTYNETLSRIQENGRLALESLSFDIRMAGFFGCGKADLIPINVIANDPPIDKIDGGVAVRGYTYGDAGAAFVDAGLLKGVANSDAIVIRRASPNLLNVDENLAVDNANIKIKGNPDGFEKDDVLLVTDCTVGDLFRVTNNPNDDVDEGGKVNLAHATGSNSTNRLSKTYGPDAQVMRFEEIAFFVRQTDRRTKSGNAINALFRRVNGQVQEIVDGVEDMRAFYALDNDVTNFKAKEAIAATDWARVVAIRVHLLLSTQEPTLTEAQRYQFADDAEKGGTDKVMRHEFTQVIALRNRLP